MFFSNGQDPRTCDLTPRSNAPLSADTFSLSGRTAVDATAISGDVVNIVLFGQSTNNNSIYTESFSPANASALYNLSILHKGQCWVAQNPLLASDLTEGHHALRLADSIVTAGLAEKVVLTMAAQGGSYGAHWSPSGGTVGGVNGAGFQPGLLAWRIGMAARCLAKAGLDRYPTIIDWQQGEWDSDTTGTSQANHTAALSGMIGECRNVGLLKTGNFMLVHKCTRITAASTNGERNAIRAAQAAVCDGNLVRVGADIDTLGFSYRDDGQTHFTPAGGAAQAALKLAVYATLL